MKLSGLVAILDKAGNPTGELRQLGDTPVSVREGRVLPVQTILPDLAAGQINGPATLEVRDGEVVRRVGATTPAADTDPITERLDALEGKVAVLEGKQ